MGRVRRRGRREPGGIVALAGLIRAHRGAFEYDWRNRFHLPLTVVGDTMTWGEACRLARLLRGDPSSMLAAAIEGWDHPISREALAALDLFDLMVQVNSDPKKPKPKPHHGRPWKFDDVERTRRGNAAGRTPEQVKALLRSRFGQPEAPI